jgi:hypothetical protein
VNALTIHYKQPVVCTGISATWCPNCGDCSCPRDENGSRWDDEDSPTCPLHGSHTMHCSPPEGPTRDDLLAWAAEQPCEYGPGEEGLPCVEDDPEYRCMPCWAFETLYGHRRMEPEAANAGEP